MEDTQEYQSETLAEPVHAAPPEQVLNYYFPVEIVIAGRLADQERELIQAQIYQELHEAILDKLS